MKIIISTPNVNLNVSKVVGVLKKLNYLDSFWTTFFLPFRLKFFQKRHYKEISYKFVKFHIFKEVMRKISIILNLKILYSEDKNIFSAHSVSKHIDRKVANYILKNNKINVIYSYEDCSKQSFKVAKLNNIKTIYDLTTPYWRYKQKILHEELKLQPDWNLSSTEIFSPEKCKDKDEELNLSDQIIVASSFAAKSLELHNFKKKPNIKIIPYGIDCPKEKIINKREKNETFKIFFAGRPTLSKGIQYVIESTKQLDFPWQIEIAGSIPENPDKISRKMDLFFNDERCRFLGQLSNSEVLERMKKCHVFLFPSLFEGFGQVLLESISCGLPIITTNNTAGSDIIEDNKNGFLTPIRDTNKTIQILNSLYGDDELRKSIAENAFLGINKFSWENYQKEITKTIRLECI